MLDHSFGPVSRRLMIAGLLALTVTACAKKNSGDLAAGTAVPGSAQDFIVNVGDRVFFTVDSSSITSEGQATLTKQAQWLQQYPNYGIMIEGHADERGTREYNIGLSARRATSVKSFLVSRGIPDSRLRTIAYGKERPVAVCDDASCWNQNRRGVTVLNGAGS